MKHVIIAVMVVATIAFVANAGAPPGGWGVDFNNWETYSNPYNTGHTLWDSNTDSWHSYEFGHFGTSYPAFTVDFYNEMSLIETLDWTNAVVHRTGNVWDAPDSPAETIEIVTGTVRSNHKLYIGVENDPAQSATFPDLAHLFFMNNATGGTSTPPESDIDVTWYYRYGPGLEVNPAYGWRTDWISAYSGPEDYLFFIEPCDHWFQLRLVFVVPYHWDDGHWAMAGFGCPKPQL